MNILALEPYHAGSHAAFLDGWIRHSRHAITPLTLPAHHWKWRMRHAAVTFAERADALVRNGERFDAVWCSSMLDLAAFCGLVATPLSDRPAVVYFHENQLTYPDRRRDPRDVHFALTHVTSALAAVRSGGGVWWNSAYHRDAFLGELDSLLKTMPGRELDNAPTLIRGHSRVLPPGIDAPPPPPPPAGTPARTREPDAPLRIVWAARWEHDKGPELLEQTLDALRERGVDFRIDVLGESFANRPAAFDLIHTKHGDRVGRFGYAEDREDYLAALAEADVFLSTARHEFFGIAAVEAAAAGCAIAAPRGLAYEEVFGEAALYHEATPGSAADAVLCAGRELATRKDADAREIAVRHAWSRRGPELDAAMEAVVEGGDACGDNARGVTRVGR
ncbi:MAG: tRNA-queuosine alpha-mannosyltransferase domain-containing protein [Phycisphaeraceae bacterium]